MKAIVVNGGPRRRWNTATLLESALAGAKAEGADAELVHLYPMRYKGCVSCFSCKRLGGANYGKCAVHDGLTPILERIAAADVLILGSPVYFHAETGALRSFLERLLFPYVPYTPEPTTIFPRRIPTGLIYTMNVTEESLADSPTTKTVLSTSGFLKRVFGSCEVLLSTDTYQFSDYAKYLSTRWDPVAKAKRHEEVFPQDCRQAFDLGARLVLAAKAL